MADTSTSARSIPVGVLAGAAAVGLSLWLAWPAVTDLARQWIDNEAYSHGFVLLAVALFLAAQRVGEIPADALPSRLFVPALVGSLLVVLIACLSELHVVAQYGLFGVLGSLVLGTWGWRGVRGMLIPLLLVFLTIPLPGFFEVKLTSGLKLISSKIGAVFLQQVGVPVFSEGNVIDLGSYRLQVADACSGLNYMIPLLAIGVMMAGFLHTTLWRRIALVLLTIPVTVLMNVLRIAIAGLLVKYVGPETAEGFIHDFEGWMVFVASLALMLPIAAVLLRVGPHPASLRRAFVVDLSMPASFGNPASAAGRRNLVVATVLTLLALGAGAVLQGQEKLIPTRTQFEVFPKLVEDWVGSHGILDEGALEMLRLTDYLYGTYASSDHGQPVEILSTWYAVQTDGATPHSPDICLPGAGWEILSLQRTAVVLPGGVEVPVNRAVMERRGERMLAYYWFQQRGRLFANEFAMKWYIIQDSVTQNRVDGGMVRLTTMLDGPTAEGDQRLQDFMTAIWPILPRYLPE